MVLHSTFGCMIQMLTITSHNEKAILSFYLIYLTIDYMIIYNSIHSIFIHKIIGFCYHFPIDFFFKHRKIPYIYLFITLIFYIQFNRIHIQIVKILLSHLLNSLSAFWIW